MKRKLTLALFAAFMLAACRKDQIEKSIPSIPQIPEQENNQPVDGTTVNNNNIVYTQVNQDLSYNKFITIDADKNGKNDFYFTSVLIYFDNESHMYLLASPVSASGSKLLLDNRQELVMNGMWGKPLDAGAIIGATVPANTEWNSFFTKGVVLDAIDNGTPVRELYGPWIGKTDKYLGMQIIINGKVHFGWIHLSQDVNEARITIVSFAFNAKPDETIKAGQID